MLDKRFRRNLTANYVAQAIGAILSLAFVTVVVRVAGLAVQGQVAVMLSVVALASNLLAFRTTESVVKFWKSGDVQQDLQSRQLALVGGLALDIAAGILSLGALLLFAPQIATSLLKSPGSTYAVTLFGGLVCLMSMRCTGIGLLVAEERFLTIAVISVVDQVLKISVVAVCVGLGVQLTVEYLALTLVITNAIVTVPILSFVIGRIMTVWPPAIGRERIIEYARFSATTFVSSSLKAASQNWDVLILGYLTKADTVGLYSFLRQPVNATSMITAPIASQVYPRFVDSVARGAGPEIHEVIRLINTRLLRQLALVAVLLVPAVIAYAWISRIELSFTAYLTFILLLAGMMVMQRLWWTRPFALAVRPNLSLQAAALAALATPALLYSLVKQLGLVGAPLATLIVGLLLATYWKRRLETFL